MYYKREIIKEVNESLNDYPVTLITGARQVGKTTLVKYFNKYKNYKYISFDDPTVLAQAKENVSLFLKKQGTPLIIDEVQRAPEIFNALENVVNTAKWKKGSQNANGMYILTGSQKFNLMKGVTESMAGRVGIIELEPLSQAEIMNWDEVPFKIDNLALLSKEQDRHLVNDDLYKFILKGFYPGRWENEKNNIRKFYSNYIQTYIERDVSQIINIQLKDKFLNFIFALASMTGQEFIVDKLSKIIGVDNKTINAWVSILITSNIVSLIPPFIPNSITKRIVRKHKIFFNDTGLACYLLGIESTNHLLISKHKGPLIETYIFNEIKKTYKNKNIDPRIYYYRDSNQNEIDLIVLDDGKLNLIECKSGEHYNYSDIKSFKQLENTIYPIQGKCILCTTNESYMISNDIFAFPIKII